MSKSESENPAIPSPTPKRTRPRANKDWWPDQLDLSVLYTHPPLSDPMGGNFNYAEEFKKLDVNALKKDIEQVMTTSQDWWPADYGHYGPFFIRMTWPAAGSSQQLARQREPRQSAPVALAGQAKVRQQDLLGRPDHLRRQLCL